MAKTIGKWIMAVWLSIGMLSLLSILACHVLSRAGWGLASSKIRFPIGHMSSFAVDRRGHIICFTTPYRRLQIFDKEGALLRGWFVNTTSFSGQVRVDSNDHINVVTDRDERLVFDSNGILLSTPEEGGLDEVLQNPPEIEAQHRDDEGNFYTRSYGPLRTQILRVTPTSERQVVVSDPFYLCPFRGGFSIGLFLAPPVLILSVRSIVWNRLMKTREKANRR
jgi:hypothetical protein